MNREEKSQTIQEIAAQIEGAEAIFAVDYRGISVPQAAELRGKLREADSSFRVVKNRLTKRAAEQAGEDRLADLLVGPTALTFVRGDTAAAAKAITNFNKEHEILTYKGGLMGETVLDEAAFKSIARLPSREVLVGQFAGIVASPLTGVVRGLNALIQGLATQLGQIAEQGLVSGEAPAPSTAGPVPDEGPPAGEAETEGSQDAGATEATGAGAEVEAEAADADAAERPLDDSSSAGDAVGGTLPEEASATAGEGGSPAAAGPAVEGSEPEASAADADDTSSEDSNEEEG